MNCDSYSLLCLNYLDPPCSRKSGTQHHTPSSQTSSLHPSQGLPGCRAALISEGPFPGLLLCSRYPARSLFYVLSFHPPPTGSGISAFVCKCGQAGPSTPGRARGGVGALHACMRSSAAAALAWACILLRPHPLTCSEHILFPSLCPSPSVCQDLRIFLSAPPAASDIWNPNLQTVFLCLFFTGGHLY